MNSNVAGRNLIVAIILSLFTFGIYTIYWMYMLDLETAELSGEGALGILLIVLNFITSEFTVCIGTIKWVQRGCRESKAKMKEPSI